MTFPPDKQVTLVGYLILNITPITDACQGIFGKNTYPGTPKIMTFREASPKQFVLTALAPPTKQAAEKCCA